MVRYFWGLASSCDVRHWPELLFGWGWTALRKLRRKLEWILRRDFLASANNRPWRSEVDFIHRGLCVLFLYSRVDACLLWYYGEKQDELGQYSQAPSVVQSTLPAHPTSIERGEENIKLGQRYLEWKKRIVAILSEPMHLLKVLQSSREYFSARIPSAKRWTDGSDMCPMI